MNYRDDWDKSKERLAAFLKGELIDRCCVSIVTPKNGKNNQWEPLPNDPQDKALYWTDGEWVLRRYKRYFENTYFGGEAFPLVFLNLGAAGAAGYFRDVKHQFEETVWFFPLINHWHENALHFDPEGLFYSKTIKLAEYLVNESKGDFFVSMPDISGWMDALAHLRGSENLLMDMVTEKETVHQALDLIKKAWFQMNEAIYPIVMDNNDGGSCIGWMDTWGPGKHNQMQCDLSVMIAPEMFREYVMPELEVQTQYLDSSVYHFDGIEQIRHLDMILSLEKLSAIQWTSVAGQPSPLAFIPTLKKIQKSGKSLILYLQPSEVEPIMAQLSSKGLYLYIRPSTEDDGQDILRKVAKFTHE